MARLTRADRAIAAGCGALLGALIALIGQLAGLPLTAGVGLCIIGAAGLGAVLAMTRAGPR